MTHPTAARTRWLIVSGLFVWLALVASARAQVADVSGAYDGTLTVKKPAPATAPAAILLVQNGKTVSGTVALGFADPNLGGAYNVVGRFHPGKRPKIQLKGSNGHGTLNLNGGAVAADGSVTASVTLRPPSRVRYTGTLAFAPRTTATGGDPTACDAVYQANQALFDGSVMTTVLVPVCSQCHVAGGLAQATRLRVTASDPLATSRTVAALVDLANPSSSPILAKPSGVLPHGGGLQLATTSAGYATLQQWVGLIAAAQCDVGAGGGGGGCNSGSPGDQIFSGSCASCHGADARGGTGPDIHCNRNIHDTVVNGRTGSVGTMPAFTCLNDADIAGVQAFLQGLCANPTGEDLFVGNCQTCHGADGVGLGGAPDVRCTVSSRVLNAVRFGRGPAHAAMPAFTPSMISDLEVGGIRSFLAGQCGGQAADLYRSNCATCHGPAGRGGVNADGVHGPNIVCQGLNDYLEKVRFGGEGMPAFPELTTAMTTAVQQYLAGSCVP